MSRTALAVAEDAVGLAAARPLTRREAVLDLLLAILLIPASALAAALIASTLVTAGPSMLLVIATQALLSLAGLSAILAWRKQRWREIGLVPLERRDLKRALIVLLTAFAANAALTLVTYVLAPHVLEQHLGALQSIAFGLTADAPLGAALALLLLVGFYEEAVARGLLLGRSRVLLGGYWQPVLFSAALFGLGHFYQGAYGTVQTALLGVVLAAFTLRWNTLWPAIIAHAAINMLSVIQLDGLGDLSQLAAR